MSQMDFFREISQAIANDQEWSGGYSTDGKALNITRGDEFRMAIRDSTSKGTAVDCFIGDTPFRHIEG